MTLLLPNIRELFIPDPGMIIAEADLSGADAQVVAWEAQDEDLKSAFKAGLKVHHKNAADMWGAKYTEATEQQQKRLYKQIKQGVHSTNYLVSHKSMATILGWSQSEAENFQLKWFRLHPGIKGWHKRTLESLQTTRTISNQFGYRCPFFDRIDNSLTDAVAWVPQSTVAIVCFRGALQLRDRLPWVQILLQVHDSLVFQFPRNKIGEMAAVREALQVVVPYPDPLTIPWELKVSAKSWGKCKEIGWEDEEDQIWKKIRA